MTDEELAKKAEEYAKEQEEFCVLGVHDNTNELEYDRGYNIGYINGLEEGYIAGAREIQKENEQRYIDRDRAYQDLLNGWATDYRELEKENEQLKQQIDKLKEEKQYETCPYRSSDMGCDYCDYRDRDLKDEVEE